LPVEESDRKKIEEEEDRAEMMKSLDALGLVGKKTNLAAAAAAEYTSLTRGVTSAQPTTDDKDAQARLWDSILSQTHY
jgi:hypothetical protein